MERRHFQARPQPRASTPGAGMPCAVLATFLCVSTAVLAGPADAVVGRWKLISHKVDVAGQIVDTHAALLQRRPCAAAIVYAVNADQSFRLDASASTCDDQYKTTQERLYAKTRWRLDGTRITTSATNFAVGQTYEVTVSGSRMTWVGTDGQGTMTFQK